MFGKPGWERAKQFMQLMVCRVARKVVNVKLLAKLLQLCKSCTIKVNRKRRDESVEMRDKQGHHRKLNIFVVTKNN